MKKILIVIPLLLYALSLSAKIGKDNKMWVELSMGYGSTYEDIMGMMFQPVFLHKNICFSAHFVDFKKSAILSWYPSDDPKREKAFGGQCGLSTDYKKLRIICSTGISYVMYYRYPTENQIERKWFDAVGIPVSLDLDWILLEKFGLKTSLYYNYNAERPFIMANLGFMWGRLK